MFDAFSEGAKQGFEMFVSLLPVLTGLIAAITLMNASGAIAVVGKLLSPVVSLLGIPDEVIPLCVLSPVSGSGSLSVYESILTEYGPDSTVGRIASVIAASTETTFYAVTVYLGSLGIKKNRRSDSVRTGRRSCELYCRVCYGEIIFPVTAILIAAKKRIDVNNNNRSSILLPYY